MGHSDSKRKDGAWGFLIRDSDDHGVLAGAGHLAAVHDALTAEGEACLVALRAAILDSGSGHYNQ